MAIGDTKSIIVRANVQEILAINSLLFFQVILRQSHKYRSLELISFVRMRINLSALLSL